MTKKIAGGNAYVSTFSDFPEKQSGGVYSLIFQLSYYKKQRAKIRYYLNNKKQFILIKP